MAAEFDTQPDYTNEDDQAPQPARKHTRDERGFWGTLAFLMLAAVVLLLLVTQLTARVPETVGLTRADAEAKLTKSGFAVGDVSEVPAGSGKPGFVQEQAPDAGTTVRKGASVDLMVALGDNLATVPDVCGHDSANASVEILQAGFRIANSEEYSDSMPLGAAVSQSPPAGAKATAGSTVTVFYSLGPQSSANATNSLSPAADSSSASARATTGSGNDPLMLNCSRAFPGASTWSSGGDIYVRLTSGGSTRRVTSTGEWDTHPVLSPSKKYVVFLRASGSGERADAVGAVCLTTFVTHMLTLPETELGGKTNRYGPACFAPSGHSTTPNTDWIVLPQYWNEDFGSGVAPSARLLVCNVPMNSTWVSWNLQFRPALNLSIGRSGRAGCVRVTQKSGSKTVYSRDFNATTGLYPR